MYKRQPSTDAAQPARQEDLERRLLLLNDIPGVVARGTFTPGSQPGSSDLVVSVVEEEPFASSVYANNYGNDSTGEYQLGGQFQLRDLFGVGDSSRVNLTWSSRGALASGDLTTWLPLGGDGWVASAGVSHLTYQLVDAFAALGSRGEANSVQAGLSYPILRTLDRNLVFQTYYQHSKLRDLIPLIAIENKKTIRSLTTGLNFDNRDSLLGGGRSRASAVLETGVLNLDSLAIDPLGKAGNYTRRTFDVSREQVIHANGLVYARLLAQQADKNLDSSEKMSLGGPYAVRAYGPGEASIDEGKLIIVEYRYVQPLTGGTLTWRVFQDRGSGRIDHNPLTGTSSNEVVLKGGGLGFNWSTGGDFDVALTAAWRGSRLPSVNGDHQPRVYMQLIKGF